MVLLLSIQHSAIQASEAQVKSDENVIESDVLPELYQEPQHAISARRVAALFSRNHYKEISIDDQLSSEIFDRYLRLLDFNRHIFLKQDIDAFEKYRNKFDDALNKGQLQIAYDMYQINLQKRVERFEYALSLLDKPFDFNKEGDLYLYDREEAQWPATVAELNELWRQRVKYDALNLKLAGKEAEESNELLAKRYKRAIKRLHQTKSEDVFQTFMNAFSHSIEAHTSYLSPRNAERFQMEMNLSFEGIGAVLQVDDDFTVIQSIVPGGPAEKSNAIKPEDKIIGVAQDQEDFVDVIGWRLDEVVELIKGPKGTTVRLQVLDGATESKDPRIVSLVRDKIKLEARAAKSEIYEPDFPTQSQQKLGVIKIPSFYNNLSQDVQKEINKLKEQDIDGMIVDLRGNGGGSLTEATLLTGLFIDKGPVVQIRDGAGRINVNKDTDGVIYYDGPLTVLVDRFSASASEIFAAALQDYGRALIVGEQTFGKGTVQQHRGLGRIYDMYNNPLGSVQYTIAKFYRINGGSTQHQGVIPDVLFPSAIDPAEWGESQQENALPWDSIKRARYTTFEDTSMTLAQLNQLHVTRTKQDPEFAYIYSDIDEFKENKQKKGISLVEAERLTEKQKNEAKRLTRSNERLQRMGKAKVETLADLPEELSEIDPFLDEAAMITLDMLATGKYAIAQ
jgi:carboxyl-terminal processing protease